MDKFTPRTWNQPMNMADIDASNNDENSFFAFNKSRRTSATEIDIKRTFFAIETK